VKTLFKWVGILLAVLVLLVVIAGIVLMFVVDKEMIAGQMESLLHRQVTIQEIDVGIFSVVSGVEVRGVRVSNAKTPGELEALRGKPVEDSDLFAGLAGLNLKVKLLPLLSGKVELRELVLVQPVVNIVRYRSGRFNFSDLLESGTAAKGAPAKEPPASSAPGEKAPPPAAGQGKASEPFTADAIPVSLTLGKLGVENGTVTYSDRKLDQRFQVYDLTFLAHDAEIDPKDLASRNHVNIRFEAGIKPLEPLKAGAVETFDVALEATGRVKPFDVKTRALDPEVSLEAGSPRGTLSGLRVFEAIRSVPALEQFTGELAFLKDRVEWKDGTVDAWYKAGTAKISKARIPAGDYTLDLAGAVETQTQGIDLDVGMELAEEENQAVRAAIEKNVAAQLSGDVARYVPPEKVADLVMKRLVNEKGRIYLQFEVAGTLKSPRPTLVSPELPPLGDLVKELGGDALGIAGEAAKKEAEKAVEKGKKELGDQIQKGLEGLKF